MKYKKIDLSGLHKDIEEDAAKSFIDHRINCKKPLTQRAFDQAMKKAFEQSHMVRMSPTELIDWTVEKGWLGININYTLAAISREYEAMATTSTRNLSVEDQLNDTSWALLDAKRIQ